MIPAGPAAARPSRRRLGARVKVRAAALVLAAGAALPTLLGAERYRFDLTYDPGAAVLAGTQVISFTRAEVADGAVLALLNNLGAVPNPYDNPLMEDWQYQSGFDPAYTRIDRIVDAAGNDVEWEEFTPPVHGRLVTYPAPGLAVRLTLPERDDYRLTVTFRTRLPARRAGDLTSLDGVFVQRFGWYPRLYPDPAILTLPAMDGYRVRIAAPPGYRVISHAEQRAAPGAAAHGAEFVIERRSPAAAIPLIIAPQDRWRELAVRSAGPRVRVLHRAGSERQARKLAGYAVDVLDRFAAWLGPLDYRQVTIVEGVRPGLWGYASDGMVLLGSGAFDADAPFRELGDRLLEFLVAHEIAHFYFGVGAGVDFIGENWLSESLAQYAAVDYLERKYGAADNLFPRDAPLARVAGSVLGYASARGWLQEGFRALLASDFDGPVVTDRDEERTQNGQAAVIYSKGALAVRQLATEMGKPAFDAALADFAGRFRYRFADTDRFLALLQRHRPGMAGIGERVLRGTRYPDFGVTGVTHERGKSRVAIRDYGDSGLAAPVRVVAESGGAGQRARTFTVRGDAVLEVAGRVTAVEIDPDWYTLDTDRKNNHYPRKLSRLVRQYSAHEADLIGIDLRVLETSPEALDLGAGVGFWSTGTVSYRVAAGIAARFAPPRPVEPGAYAAAALSLPASARLSAGFLYRREEWSGSVRYRRPLWRPVEIGLRPVYHSGALAFAAGLGIDRQVDRPVALRPWIGLDSSGLRHGVPHVASVRQRAAVLPAEGGWALQSSVALAVPLRVAPRVYVVPSADVGADWRLFGVGTAQTKGVASRLRAGTGDTGRPAAGGEAGDGDAPAATGRLYGSMEVIVPLIGGRRDRLLDAAFLRSVSASLYVEAEKRFTAFEALTAGGAWDLHAGIELSVGLTSFGDLLSAPLGVGLDVPLRTAHLPSTWRAFLSMNVPLRLYTTLLAD